MRNNEKKEEENKKDGQKVKDYNALIRKKNMILLQSKWFIINKNILIMDSNDLDIERIFEDKSRKKDKSVF